MKDQRINRRVEIELLDNLYRFYDENSECLRFNNDFRKVIEAQETKIAHIFNEIIKEREEN